MLLKEETKKNIVHQAYYYYIEFSKKYFLNLYEKFGKRYPPRFKVVLNIKHAGIYFPLENEIHLNYDFVNSIDELKSIVYHETLHYYLVREYRYYGHGEMFVQWMKEINRKEGKEVITISTTYNKISSNLSVKEYYVFILNNTDTEISWAWSPTIKQRYIDDVSYSIFVRNYKNSCWFKTSNIIYKSGIRYTGGKFGTLIKNDKPDVFKNIKKSIENEKNKKNKL